MFSSFIVINMYFTRGLQDRILAQTLYSNSNPQQVKWLLTLFCAIMFMYTVKMNMLYLINRIVATDYKQYY